MQALADDLRRTVESAAARLEQLSEAQAMRPRAPGKWCPKQVLGHLIDSACNNHRRFVLARTQQDLVFPGYDEKAWEAAQRFEAADWSELVDLWRLYNLHIARLIEGTSEEIAQRPRLPHSLDRIAWRTLPADQPATLAYLMRDYVGHLRHHLGQALAPSQG